MSYLISFVLRFTIINIKVVHLLRCFSLERQYPLILNLVWTFPPTQYSNITVSTLHYFYIGQIRTGGVTSQLLSSRNSCFSLLLENSQLSLLKCSSVLSSPFFSSGNPIKCMLEPLNPIPHLSHSFLHFVSLHIYDCLQIIFLSLFCLEPERGTLKYEFTAPFSPKFSAKLLCLCPASCN